MLNSNQLPLKGFNKQMLPTIANQSINQSIQSSIVPISPAKPGSVAWQPNQCSTAKSKKQFHKHQQAMGNDGIYGGKAKSKRCVFKYFLKVAFEMAEWTDRGRLKNMERFTNLQFCNHSTVCFRLLSFFFGDFVSDLWSRNSHVLNTHGMCHSQLWHSSIVGKG